MNAQQYSELMKHLSKERKVKEKEKLLSALKRVRLGERVSVQDLDRVREYVNLNSLDHTKKMNISHLSIELEQDVYKEKDDVERSKNRLKRKGIDLKRLRRMRRVHQNEYYTENTNEL